MFKISKFVQSLGIACFTVLFLGNVLGLDSEDQSTKLNSISNHPIIESCFPYLAGTPDQSTMLVQPLKSISKEVPLTNKTYILPATPATTQWGYFDKGQLPVLKINPGDTVVIETLTAADNQVVPGLTIDKLAKISSAVPGRGPHTVTGPIYVNGAEPGDVLKIHLDKIIPRSYASNNSLPGKGLLPKQFPRGQVRYFYLDLAKMQMQFAPGIIIPLHPFPGLIAVSRAESGKFNTDPPGPFGGNMDLPPLTQGSTLYLPVFTKGALIWTGDSHAGQGNGEIDLTAIETAFQNFTITVNLIKNKSLKWPRVETSDAWVTVGYDKDLNQALNILKDETIRFLMEQRKLSKDQAETTMLKIWNCPISEVVNGVQGVYCIIPKNIHAKSPLLPSDDNATYFVTYAKNSDLEEAMRSASMEMIDKISRAKSLAPVDAYVLASLTMDCRISPYSGGEKEVHCMLPKDLWESNF